MSANQRPRRTNRLQIDLNEGMMARLNTYLLQKAQTDSPMTRRVLIESALCEYFEGKASEDKEQLFNFMKIMRDDQYRIQKTLESLIERVADLTASLMQKPTGPSDARVDSLLRSDPATAAILDRLDMDTHHSLYTEPVIHDYPDPLDSITPLTSFGPEESMDELWNKVDEPLSWTDDPWKEDQ
jgi:hypothetical protein